MVSPPPYFCTNTSLGELNLVFKQRFPFRLVKSTWPRGLWVISICCLTWMVASIGNTKKRSNPRRQVVRNFGGRQTSMRDARSCTHATRRTRVRGVCTSFPLKLEVTCGVKQPLMCFTTDFRFVLILGVAHRLELRFPSGSPTVLSASCTADLKGRTILPRLGKRLADSQKTKLVLISLLPHALFSRAWFHPFPLPSPSFVCPLSRHRYSLIAGVVFSRSRCCLFSSVSVR